MAKKAARHSGTAANTKALPQPLSQVTNVEAETDAAIAELANRKRVALIAFLAPYVGVRISPTRTAEATIGLPEEFGMEALVGKVKKAGIQDAYLLVNSPGGLMSSAYKIARAIRRTFKRITTFVPHVAASGGTLLALTGNEIVMGLMSHITPLDVQVRYKGTMVSAATFMRFFARASKWFETTTPEESPYPQRALADKLNDRARVVAMFSGSGSN